MIRIFSGIFSASSNRHAPIQEPINPASEDIFYGEGLEEKKLSSVPNREYLLKEVKSSEPDGKQNSSLVCTDKTVEGKQVLDITRLDSKDIITDLILLVNDAGGLKRIEEILAEVCNSWTSRDPSANKALDNLKVSYGLGFVDIHDPACFSPSSGNRYLFLKLPLKDSSGALIPIARTRNWKGEPIYLNPSLVLGKYNGREFVLLKNRDTYHAIDRRGGLRIATNIIDPNAPQIKPTSLWASIFRSKTRT